MAKSVSLTWPSNSNSGGDFTLVSGADSRFFRTLCQFLLSIRRQKIDQHCRLILYDLGLTGAQRTFLQERFWPTLRFDLRRFPFEQYPDYFHLRHRNYAWKPVIIAEVFAEVKGKVLWLDSGTLFLAALDPVVAALEQFGVYVPFAGGSTIQELTHPATLAYLQVDPQFYGKRLRAAGACGFNYHYPHVRDLVDQWKTLTCTEDCYAPTGASMANNRFDQSILTILLHQWEARYGLHLVDDSLDISSATPLPFLSARNKVDNCVPLALDFWVRGYFRLARSLDIMAWRWKQRWR